MLKSETKGLWGAEVRDKRVMGGVEERVLKSETKGLRVLKSETKGLRGAEVRDKRVKGC